MVNSNNTNYKSKNYNKNIYNNNTDNTSNTTEILKKKSSYCMKNNTFNPIILLPPSSFEEKLSNIN